MTQQPERHDTEGVVVPFPGARHEPPPPDPGPGAELEPAPEVLDAEIVDEGTRRPAQTAPAVRPSPLEVVRGERTPLPVDLDTSPLPMWLRDWHTFRSSAHTVRRRATHRTLGFLLQLPGILWWLAVAYPWRGMWRVLKRFGAFVYDLDTADLRHEHAGTLETIEYVKISRERRANLHARWIAAGLLLAPVVVPLLAWTYPRVLSGLAGVLVFALVVKLIPGRGPGEVLGAAVVGVGTYFGLPYLLAMIPVPPAWPFALLSAVVWLILGWIGRPAGKSLTGSEKFARPSELTKPTADLVIAALVASVPGITDKNRDEIRVHTPGVAHARRGYHLSLELPPGVTVSDVMENREEFAAALRRVLGCVWPARGHMHPGHLELFIGHQAMATAPQDRWKLADGQPIDIFNPIPLFTDQQGQWVDLTLAYNHMVIGGAPGYGKSYGVRQIGVAVAFDPRVRLVTLDGKGNGDLSPLRLVAHGFYEGDEPEELAEQLAAVQGIRKEMRRRARFLRELPREENPQSKVTSELVDRYRHLAPIVLLVDECQVYTECDNKEMREKFIAAFTDLVKRGRSAGIIPVFCTQKPDASVLPTAIADNCSVRLCFRVNGQRANDTVLGNEMHRNGIKATKFGADDKGLAWLKGDGADPIVVRTVHELDSVASEALLLKARAIREARGLLTGYAAGEEAASEAVQVNLLEDSREVMDRASATAMHYAELRAALAEFRPATWGHLTDRTIGPMLRDAGARTRTVWSQGTDGKGVRREWLNVAATADEDPDAITE